MSILQFNVMNQTTKLSDLNMVQHFGHFLLTNLLLPKLRETALKEQYPSKVITLSSSLYTLARRPRSNQNATKELELGIDLNDLQCKKKRYTLFEQYAQSKLANILFARELGRREKLRAEKLHEQHEQTKDKNSSVFCPIKSYSLHPGLVRTDVVRDMPWYLYYPNIVFAFFVAVLQKTPRAGAYTSVFCAVSDEDLNEEVCYYVNSEISKLSEAAKSDEVGGVLLSWLIYC